MKEAPEIEINDLFGADASSPMDSLKELFSAKNPKIRTDITAEQIQNLALGYFLADTLKSSRLRALLDEFVILRISKDRKSRQEFVDSAKGMDIMGKQAMGIQGILGGMRR